MIKLITILSEIRVVGQKPLLAKLTYPKSNYGDNDKLFTIYDGEKPIFKGVKYKSYFQTGLFQNPRSKHLENIKNFLNSKNIKYDLVTGSGGRLHINIPNEQIAFIN